MILITGAGGLLGSNLVLAAIEAGHEVIAAYHRTSYQVPGALTVQVDVTKQDEIRDLLSAYRPAWIINCAAATNVDACEKNPAEAWDLNAEAPKLLARAAHAIGGRMIHISTDAVFDGTSGNYHEEDPTAPVNVYGRSKLAGESAVLQAGHGSLVVRTTIYGWNLQPKHSLSEWALQRLEAGNEVPGFTDAIFTPILVNDLAEILLEMMHQNLSGIYHVAGSEAVSKFAFCRMVSETFELDSRLVVPTRLQESNLIARRALNAALSTQTISQTLGRSMPSVMAGLARFRDLRSSGFLDRLTSPRRAMDNGGV